MTAVKFVFATEMRRICFAAERSGALFEIRKALAGGLLAMGLATLSPDFYRSAFIGVPSEFGLMLKYAWVGGSIWGAMFGAVLSVVIPCTTAASHWRRQNLPPT